MRLQLRNILLLTWLTLYLTHTVEGVDKSELKTKQLLQSIRKHLAEQVDEVVKEKECEGGLTLCEPSKSKEEAGEGSEEDDEEDIPPPPKIRGGHKPIIKVSPKEVIQTMIHKVHKPLVKKTDTEEPEDSKAKKLEKRGKDEEDDSDEDDDGDGKKKKKKKQKKSKSEQEEEAGFPEDIHVFAATSNIVQTALCRKHSRVYLRQLKRYKMWALMMYDASAKLPAGILQGNINQYGDFDECLSVNAMFKDPKTGKISADTPGIRGKYCLATIDVAPSDEDPSVRQAVYRSQSYAFIRSKVDDPGHFIPRFSSINWGLCVPSACEARDVEQSVVIGLSEYNDTSGLIFDVKVHEGNCVVKDDTRFHFSFMTLLTIIFFGFFVGIAGYATYKDLGFGETSDGSTEPEEESGESDNEKEEQKDESETPEEEGEKVPRRKGSEVNVEEKEEKPQKRKKSEVNIEEKIQERKKSVGSEEKEEENAKKEEEEEKVEGTEGEEVVEEEGGNAKEGKLFRLMMAFSLKRNFEELVRDSEEDSNIACINGVKALFTLMLYFAHKTIPLALTPLTNRIVLTQLSNEATSVLLRASIIYTDSFLLISGVLTSYNLSKEIFDKGSISWLRRSLARYIRLTPALLATVLFYAHVSDHLGSGPLWNEMISYNAELCRSNMWKNLLYIQNFFSFETMCAPQSHQLALDMQLTLMTPLFVYLLYRYDKVGLGIVQGIFLFSSVMRYISTSNNELSLIIYHGMTVSQLYRTANLLYSQTLHRASPYIMGVLLGFYLQKFGKKLEMPKSFVAFGWIAAFSFGFLSIVTPSHLADKNYEYDVDEAAQYASLSPISWSLALGWTIVACHLGHGGRINDFLCNRLLLIFSRTSYCVYLTQFLVFFYKVGIKRVPETFSLSGSFDVGEFLTILIISTAATLLFDLPMKEVKAILLERTKSGEAVEEGETGEEEQDELMEENLLPEEAEFLPEEEEFEGEEVDEEYEEEEVVIRPLKKISKGGFEENQEDMEFWEKENKELEDQRRKKTGGEEEKNDFWGNDED